MQRGKSGGTTHDIPVASEYVVDTRIGIEWLLEALVKAGSAAYVTSRALTTRTSVRLLGIDSRAGRLSFVPLSALPVESALLGAENVLFTTDQDGVPIEFTCQRPARVRIAERDAYAVRLPEYVIRLQRRNAYRLPSPAIVCRLELEGAHGPVITPGVLDVSAGGLDLEMPANEPPLNKDTFYTCSLFLPALGNVWVRLKIVSVTETPSARRYGCQFVDLSAPSELLLQRYIIEEQRARRRIRNAAAKKPPA
jgi:c-di-GMP-binding flagellar brake protein YcgR